eukprot:TRINITY_DN6095_c2_g1_i1.p1 TRINITY_DN6095_c2_g1~~TRINITY_DN6095_c2_g1_i1.p1  ORF type:complete len:923 (-),score=155.82 TRINITY_DN6095_c2_g1_i1:794-3562(-)
MSDNQKRSGRSNLYAEDSSYIQERSSALSEEDDSSSDIQQSSILCADSYIQERSCSSSHSEDSHSSSSSSTDYIISGDTSYSQAVETADTLYTDSSSSTGSTGATITDPSKSHATLYACSAYIEDKLGKVEPAITPEEPKDNLYKSNSATISSVGRQRSKPFVSRLPYRRVSPQTSLENVSSSVDGASAKEFTVSEVKTPSLQVDTKVESRRNSGSEEKKNQIVPPIVESLLPKDGAYARTAYAYDSSESEEKSSSSVSASGEDDSETPDLDSSQQYWNDKFQELMANGDDPTTWSKLSTLGRDFISVAEMYGRVIISELYVDNKTIPPMKLGGIAGGSKYIVQGVLFKFSLDSCLGNSTWLYGKKKRNDEKAMKSACNELKGLNSMIGCRVKGIRYPLMASIHYRGYCLLVISILPISSTSLVYGSNDGGATCNASEPKVNRLMTKTGKILNLQAHLVRGQMISFPGDIEVHKGKDKNYYCLDFGRVMPPEYPSGRRRPGHPIFYDLLRPTFVAKNSVPLSSDAFSRWGNGDPNFKQHDQHVIDASNNIYNVLIPRVAASLVESPKGKSQLIDYIHREGLCCRHLGYVRAHILQHTNENSKEMARVILVECIARALKCEIRSVLRNKMEELKIATSQPYLKALYGFLKPVLYYRKPYPSHFGLSKDGCFLPKGNEQLVLNQVTRTVSSLPLPVTRRTASSRRSAVTSSSHDRDNLFNKPSPPHSSPSNRGLFTMFSQRRRRDSESSSSEEEENSNMGLTGNPSQSNIFSRALNPFLSSSSPAVAIGSTPASREKEDDHTPSPDKGGFFTRSDERFPQILVANHPIPSFHRIYYFEVTLRSGSTDMHVGLIPENYALGTEHDICTKGYFFSFSNGKLTIKGEQQNSLCLVAHGDTIGILYDQVTSRMLLTKNDITIGDELSS